MLRNYGSLKEDEKALTLNIERLILALPGKFRVEEERDRYNVQLQKDDAEIARLQHIVEALKEETRQLTEDKAKLLEQLKINTEFTDRALGHLVSIAKVTHTIYRHSRNAPRQRPRRTRRR